MNKYRMTFKRIQAFYKTICIDAATATEAREKADVLIKDGIDYDYLKGNSDLIGEYIFKLEQI